MDDKLIAPVHWLENVDGDPLKVQTACGKYKWTRSSKSIGYDLDPDRDPLYTVTCPDCLAAMRAKATGGVEVGSAGTGAWLPT